VSSRLRVVGALLLVAAVLGLAVAALGVLIAEWRDSPVRDPVGYALIDAGALALLLVGGGLGGVARDTAARAVVIGGRLHGAAFRQTPLGYAVIGLVLVAAGVLVFLG
jgi:hypothetical protein